MVNTVYFLTLDLNSSTFVFLITNGPLISSFWQRELIQGTKHFPTGMFVLSPPHKMLLYVFIYLTVFNQLEAQEA